MSLRWRVSRGHPPRWRYVGAMSKGMYVHIRERLPVSTEVEVDTMTSHTAGPNARGLSRRHADWRCTELGSWCRPGQLRASRLDQFADKAVKLAKRKASAALLPSVVMEGESLEPIYQFDYFECRFTSDGDDKADMPHCTAIVDERSRSIDYLWRDNRLHRSQKLRLFAASACATRPDARQRGMDPKPTPGNYTTSSGGRMSRRSPSLRTTYLLTAVRKRRHQWLQGPYNSDACRSPSAPCDVGAGPTSWTTVTT